MKKIYDNAYKLELLGNFVISPIFNIVNLYEFHEGEEIAGESMPTKWQVKLSVKPIKEIEQILVTRVSKRKWNKKYLEYMVKWKNRGFEDASWVSKEELNHLHEYPYYSTTSSALPT